MHTEAQSITDDMTELLKLSEDIAGSMKEMDVSIQNINNSINAVNALTKENRTNIESVASAVDKFKV